MTASRRLSSTWIYLSFFLILAGLAITYLGYRSQARLAMRVQEQARERGLTVTVGTAEPGVLSLNWLVERADGKRLFLSIGLNDPAAPILDPAGVFRAAVAAFELLRHTR